jgi:hypothetical protein
LKKWENIQIAFFKRAELFVAGMKAKSDGDGRILLGDNTAGRLCCDVSSSVAFEFGFQLHFGKIGLAPELPECNCCLSRVVSALVITIIIIISCHETSRK